MLIVHNKPCGALVEVADSGVDAIVTSPPYNIGHAYAGYVDSLPKRTYLDMLGVMIGASRRVLKPEGLVIFDIAERIFWREHTWLASSWVQREFAAAGLALKACYPYVSAYSDAHNGHDEDFCIPLLSQTHSSTQHVLVFGKIAAAGAFLEDRSPLRSCYPPDRMRDEAYWPRELVEDLALSFRLKGKVVLDPYMGSGMIGRAVIRDGGIFIGYDVSEECCQELRDEAGIRERDS